MRILISCLLFGFTSMIKAQPFVLPPSSTSDGVKSTSAGVNSSAAYWGNTNSLAAYAVAGDGYQDPLAPGQTDQHLGLSWTTTAPSDISNYLQQLNTTGGIVRVIFVGESAGWYNNFGYTYSGNPAGSKSYTVWQQIQSVGPLSDITYGDYFDVPLAAGVASTFDLWLDAASNDYGGVYTLFNNASAQSLWAARSISLDTWIPSMAASSLVNTYLVSFEDWRLNQGADADYSDLRIALQFFNSDGSPLSSIPEPAAWVAVAGLFSFAGVLIKRILPPRHR